jgi:hypothetical protein
MKPGLSVLRQTDGWIEQAKTQSARKDEEEFPMTP